VSLFGVSSLPTLHREVLSAVGRHREVHIFAPVVSPAARTRVLAAGHDSPSTDTGHLAGVSHRLVRTWASGNLEDHLVLAGVADEVEVIEGGDPQAARLLDRIQTAVRIDEDPRATAQDVLDADDDSIRWHRCYGPARQAEVVADVVRHLLEPTEGGADLDFGDVAILCPDLATYAPLVQAAFAGRDDVAEVPLVVSDLSLAASTPLVDTVVALLDLLDGRFRPAEVLAFAARPPVARRFGLRGDDLADLADLIGTVNVAWGVDADQRARYLESHGGLTVDAPLGSRTWEEGFAQLLGGAALADRPVYATEGLPTVPLAGVEDTATVRAVGALARLVAALAAAADLLGATGEPPAWVDALADVVEGLVDLADDDAWQWRRLESAFAAFRADAERYVGSGVPGHDLAALFASHLGSAGGRARFRSGAVTLTSLTALRGVPHRVVVLLGIDGDLGVGGARADDLLAVERLVGEPQPQREVRAQLLDAVLAAGERLVVISTGTDPRSNKDVAPSVPLAELLGVIDDTVTDAGGWLGSGSVAVRHPRHAWSTPNFSVGADAVVPGRRWGFDASALAAARRREGPDGPTTAWSPFGADPGVRRASGEVTLRQLFTSLRNPAEAFLSERLGVRLPPRRREATDGLIPLSLSGIDRYNLLVELWELVSPGAPESPVGGGRSGRTLTGGQLSAWRRQQLARGALPPPPFLHDAVGDVDNRLRQLLKHLHEALGGRRVSREQLAVSLPDGVSVVGEATVARHHPDGSPATDALVLDVRLARPKSADELVGLVTLAAATAQFPGQSWGYLQFRLDPGEKVDPVLTTRLALVDPQVATDVLAWAVDYRDHALGGFFPALPSTLAAVWDATARSSASMPAKALSAWGESETSGGKNDRGDRFDDWVAVPGDTPEFEELWSLVPTAVEADWLAAPGVTWRCPDRRIAVWAEQLWGRSRAFLGEVPS